MPGYDISLAKRLVQGVDVWLNNPTRPLEASGTSGEKAVMNGVMHFSVLDGWWVEGYKEGCGWALPLEKTYDDQNYQNELDAAKIYAIIENEIAPSYYNKDSRTGISTEWLGYIRNTIAHVACNFTTNRMMEDYCVQYYQPQYDRFNFLIADGSAKAREIAAWKKKVEEAWPAINVISFTAPNASYVLSQDNPLDSEVVVGLGGLNPEDIGVEMILAVADKKNVLHIQESIQYDVISFEEGVAKYHASVIPERTGMYQIGVRLYAKNALLPHRMDFPLVKWL